MSNIYNFFKFLEKKRGTKTPLKIKFIYTPDELMDEDLNVKHSLDFDSTEISFLPDGLNIRGYLDLTNTKIILLPDDLSLKYDLYLENTDISSIPNNLEIGGDLFVGGTPLSRKYDEEQIRKMVEDKGGYLKGKIYVF